MCYQRIYFKRISTGKIFYFNQAIRVRDHPDKKEKKIERAAR